MWGEHEPNNSPSEANGLLVSNRGYYGYSNDSWDCFKFDLKIVGEVTIDLTNHIGDGVQLQLLEDSGEWVSYASEPPFSIKYKGLASLYYICIYTESGYDNARYTLHTVFP